MLADSLRMDLVWILGFGSFVLVSLAVGLRLLALARRTRELSELVLGITLFLGGGVGFTLIVLGLRFLGEDVAPAALALGNLCVHTGTTALAVGTWRIFRPSERWPRALVATIAGVVLVSFGLRGSVLLPIAFGLALREESATTARLAGIATIALGSAFLARRQAVRVASSTGGRPLRRLSNV